MVLITAFISCKKKEVSQSAPEIKTEKSDNNKLIKFLSISLNAPIEQITYNEKEKEFVVYGKNHLSLKTVKETYNNANEYKLNYEQ